MSAKWARPDRTVLRLEGITKRFGPLLANDGIALELRRGEMLALLGENGAGKTTLMTILFGHYAADAGRRCRCRAGELPPLPSGSRTPRWPPESAWSTSTSRWPQPERPRQRHAGHRACGSAALSRRAAAAQAGGG